MIVGRHVFLIFLSFSRLQKWTMADKVCSFLRVWLCIMTPYGSVISNKFKKLEGRCRFSFAFLRLLEVFLKLKFLNHFGMKIIFPSSKIIKAVVEICLRVRLCIAGISDGNFTKTFEVRGTRKDYIRIIYNILKPS